MSIEGREKLLRLAETVISGSDAEETEVILAAGESFLTRFARNRIHQNVGTQSASAIVRTITDQRVGVAQADTLEESALTALVERARGIAAARPPLEDFKGLPSPRKLRPVEAWDEATARCSPDERAEFVEELVEKARSRNAEAAGLVETRTSELLVANTRGIRAYHRRTGAATQTVVTCGDGSGYAEDASFALGNLDRARVIRDGVGKAARSRKPRTVEPGEMDVVLEPAAVGSLLARMAYLGFGAKSYQEGRSFMAGRMGQRVTGDPVTIVDNVYDRRLRGTPFDYEGLPRKRVNLIDRGVAAGVVYDSYRAGLEKGRRASTGHALPPRYASYGPMPAKLVMSPGKDSLRGLVRGTGRGLLVTRFHYVNVVEPMRVVLTGMTRDGTFLIENGKVTGPVRNLRFTESVLEALERIEGMTRKRRVVEGDVLCPALKVRGFKFTGSTEF